MFESAQISQPFKGIDLTRSITTAIIEGRKVNYYRGFEVVALAGFPDDTILFTPAYAAPESNLNYGLNSMSDENYEFAKMSNGDERYYMKMLYKSDVQYGWSNECFISTTLTAASFTR